MLGVDPTFIFHSLNVNSNARPIKQKQQCYSMEVHEVTNVEVYILLKARFIQEVHHSEWLPNVALVKKKNINREPV